jgi:ketosteroid isomerase-like protein
MKKFIIIILSLSLFTTCCPEKEAVTDEAEIHTFIDNWHLAAWDADSAAYFGAMTEDAVFIGTDLSEVWTRQQFAEWARPYFDAGRVWK